MQIVLDNDEILFSEYVDLHRFSEDMPTSLLANICQCATLYISVIINF